MSTSSLSPLRSPTPERIIPIQPEYFYGQSGPASPDSDKGFLDPADDPLASRGIPVFTPTLDDFQDFEAYVSRIEPWGMTSGIVKIIPPKEWTAVLPSTVPQLANVKLRNPIEQEMVGHAGLFRQQNVEKRKVMSVREWAQLCAREDLRAPTREEALTGRRHTAGSSTRVTRSKRARPVDEENASELRLDDVDNEEYDPEQKADEAEPAGDKLDHDDTPMEGSRDTKSDAPHDTIDPASTLPTPPHTTASPAAAVSPSPSKDKPKAKDRTRDKAAADAARRAADAAFLETFDPHTAWLPEGTSSEDYTPELCRALERAYWRNCGLGRAPWYGADMHGSLFTKNTHVWNVASLPSALARLLRNAPISGVNTPYLYFGMWRATFAWHVEDMDLFSINYIHFGAPKHWYAVPQSRAQALETTMKGYFPRDNTQCPQFLRHKSFLASPTLLAQSSVRPNVLVQHAGEFVVTFPRGYHAGFNLGFNCAESVNFALESWIERGLRASWCTCEADSVRIDVRGLLEAQNCEPPASTSEAAMQKKSLSRKRKADALPASEPPAAKHAKTLTVHPPKQKVPPRPTEPDVPFACCLCVSSSTVGLLRVHDPPGLGSAAGLPPADGVWRAHAGCARVVPETWVDEGSGMPGEEAEVWGVDGIVKDRWALKCAACNRPRSKIHGAPIQCTKGKCSKAFHVSCAASSFAGTSYRVLEETEKEVVLLEPEVAPADSSHVHPAPTPRVIKTIKKLNVEVLCAQHNPVLIAQKKANKDDKIRRDLAALPEMSRIRIRNASGVFEVSLVKVWEDRGTVEVLWDGGQRREFRWGSIVWSADAQPVGRKPTAEELVKPPQQPEPPQPPQPPKSSPPSQPPLPTAQLTQTQQQHYNPYSQPRQFVPPRSYSSYSQQHQGMSQFRVTPQPASTWGQGYNLSAGASNAASSLPGYYSHQYFQQHYSAQTPYSYARGQYQPPGQGQYPGHEYYQHPRPFLPLAPRATTGGGLPSSLSSTLTSSKSASAPIPPAPASTPPAPAHIPHAPAPIPPTLASAPSAPTRLSSTHAAISPRPF